MDSLGGGAKFGLGANPHIWALELCPLWFKMEALAASTAKGGVSTAQGNPWNVLDEHMSA